MFLWGIGFNFQFFGGCGIYVSFIWIFKNWFVYFIYIKFIGYFVIFQCQYVLIVCQLFNIFREKEILEDLQVFKQYLLMIFVVCSGIL